MDLENNTISIGKILQNPKAKAILGRNFPELMNPFLLKAAGRMSLENTLKLAQGPFAQDQISRIISDLEAI